MVAQAERYRGCLLGLAVGDALGATLEFQPPGLFTPIQDMIGGGPFDLAPGQWTAVPVRAHQYPLALSGLHKNGSRWHVPAGTFAPHASGMPSSDREDSTLHPTIFILWGVEPVDMTRLVKAAQTLV
jgi:ADP-ribosylglycohydrolase